SSAVDTPIYFFQRRPSNGRDVSPRPVPQSRRLQPCAALAHLFLFPTPRARYILTRRHAAKQDRPRILDFLGVDARRQSVAEGVATEIAPVIDTATEHLAVPIDLRLVPELAATVLVVGMAVEHFVFILCGGGASRRTDSVRVPHGRIIGVGIQRC